jgi:VanZ family protein
MVLTVLLLLLICGFIFVFAAAMQPPRAPLWIAVFLLYVIEALRTLPLGR